MTYKDLYRRVVENALDFLGRSLEDFQTRPKYSVIHFHAGVELLLKARLMAEHWSLVVSKRQDPDWKRFESGDFISVSLDEAADRLEKIARSALTKQELESFRALARHRNRMVHFFHDVADKKVSEELLRDIAREQLVAWYLLHRLLTERWTDVFSAWKKRFAEFDKSLREHDQYLQVTFEHLKPEIEKRAKESSPFFDCPSCGFGSLEVSKAIGNLFEEACLVCGYSATGATVTCPDCDEVIIFVGDGFGQCEGCGKKFEPKDLAEVLDQGLRGTKDYFESGMPAHCVNCEGYETVVSHGGMYVCASCLKICEEGDVGQCEYCGALNAGGSMDDSFWSGCVACEGKAGYFRSKDD